MGIFDNVNWQQALPGALMGFAGGMDPKSAPMLAQSGWNAVKSYMEQQQMQQQKEQFQERLKLYKEEQSQRERQLQLSEKKFANEQDEKLDEDFIFQNLGVLSDISDDAGISEYYNRLNLKAKESGRGPLSSTVFGKVAKQWEFMPTETGEVGFGYKSDGSLWVMEKVKHKGGAKWQPAKVADRITPEMIKALRENPEMALEFASSLDKSGHGQAGQGVRNQAQRILAEKEAGIIDKIIPDMQKAMEFKRGMYEKEMQTNPEFGYDPTTKTYNNPYGEATPEGKAWKTKFETVQKSMHDELMKDYKRMEGLMLKSPTYRHFVKQYGGKGLDEIAKKAKEFEKTLSPEEMEEYTKTLKDLNAAGSSLETELPKVIAAIETKRANREAVAKAETRPGRGQRVVAPGPGPGGQPPAPPLVSNKMQSRGYGSIPAPAVPPNYVSASDWAASQAAQGRTGVVKQIQQLIEVAKQRGDIARVHRLEQQLKDVMK
jgi:hypothetical protein